MKLTGKVVFLLSVCCAVPVLQHVAKCSSAIGAANIESAEEIFTYYGASDASAAVAVGEEMFIVADDENNILRVYKTNQTGLPVFSYDLTKFLGTALEHPEADIEGATKVGDHIFWITSHGRNRDGKMRPNRYRFFATTVEVQNQNITIHPIGIPCQNLIHRLLKAETMRQLGLDKATQFDTANLTKQQRKNLAPKENGLNIEGLCASADGKTIYIGFRNPRPYSKAIIVPLNNPKEVIEKQQPPIFAAPILWDLKGFSIRSMEYSHFHRAYFIVAGPHNDEPADFVLYRWSGRKDEAPLLLRQINSDFNPEALVTFKNSARLLLLSDDGSLAVDISDASECMQGKLRKDGKCLNKYLTNPNKKHFRAISLQP